MVSGGVIPTWSLGDRLRKAREQAGLEQAELARDLGTSRTTVGNAERGDRTPRRSLVMAWSLRTGVPLAWLETGTAPSPGDGDGAALKYTPRDLNPEPTGYVSSLVRLVAA